MRSPEQVLRDMEVSYDISVNDDPAYFIVDTDEDLVVNAVIVYAEEYHQEQLNKLENNKNNI